MSIVPSDSASCREVSNSEYGRSDVSLSPPVYQGDDIMFLLKNSLDDPGLRTQLMDLYMFHVRDYSRLYKAHCAAVQSCYRATGSGSTGSTVSGASSDSSAVSGAGSVASAASGPATELSQSSSRFGKGAMRRFVRRMRAKGVASSLPGGLCYTRAVRGEARESTALALGAYPALGDFLARPREEFMPLTATRSLTLSMRSGIAHVGYSDVAAGSGAVVGGFNEALVSLAKRSEFEYGSYGHSLRSAVCGDAGLCDRLGLALNTPVGGSCDVVAPSVVESFGASVDAGARVVDCCHVFEPGPSARDVSSMVTVSSGASSDVSYRNFLLEQSGFSFVPGGVYSFSLEAILDGSSRGIYSLPVGFEVWDGNSYVGGDSVVCLFEPRSVVTLRVDRLFVALWGAVAVPPVVLPPAGVVGRLAGWLTELPKGKFRSDVRYYSTRGGLLADYFDK